MASLTIKGIPTDLMERLRELADRERRSLNQQAIVILEQALTVKPRFSDAYEAFMKQVGANVLNGDEFDNLRSEEAGRSVDL